MVTLVHMVLAFTCSSIHTFWNTLNSDWLDSLHINICSTIHSWMFFTAIYPIWCKSPLSHASCAYRRCWAASMTDAWRQDFAFHSVWLLQLIIAWCPFSLMWFISCSYLSVTMMLWILSCSKLAPIIALPPEKRNLTPNSTVFCPSLWQIVQ